jgi:kinesin family protein 23
MGKSTPRVPREKTIPKIYSTKKEDRVQVFCRLRPAKDNPISTYIKLLSPTDLLLTTPAASKGTYKESCFKFEHIFSSQSSQNEVFDHVAYPLVENLLKGKNGVLFTYGVTGSGKTHTLSGSHDNPGVIPKCIYSIFNSIADCQTIKYVIKSDKMNGFEVQHEYEAVQDQLNVEKTTPSKSPLKNRKVYKDKSYVNDGARIVNIDSDDNSYAVFVSYVEIYNNTVFDLLDESPLIGKGLQNKILREDLQRIVYVNGVVEVEVKSAEEVFQFFNLGQKRKKVGNTVLNAVSSRSHSIFTIRVVRLKNNKLEKLQVSQLSLVDLAGSERTNRTQNTGQMLKESGQINNSLMSLRTCLGILKENQLSGGNKLVPYRESRLTLLFKNYFEGDGQVRMIVCVNPSIDDFEENLHVMKFAEITRDVKLGIKPELKCKSRATPRTLRRVGDFADDLVRLEAVPRIKLDFANLEESRSKLDEFANILKNRIKAMSALSGEVEHRETAFRKRLHESESTNGLSKSEAEKVRILILKQEHEIVHLKSKFAHSEKCNRLRSARNEELKHTVTCLSRNLVEKEQEIALQRLERDELKQQQNHMFTDEFLENLKMNHAMQEEFAQEKGEEQTTKKEYVERVVVPLKKRRSRSAGEVEFVYKCYVKFDDVLSGGKDVSFSTVRA